MNVQLLQQAGGFTDTNKNFHGLSLVKTQA